MTVDLSEIPDLVELVPLLPTLDALWSPWRRAPYGDTGTPGVGHIVRADDPTLTHCGRGVDDTWGRIDPRHLCMGCVRRSHRLGERIPWWSRHRAYRWVP